MARNRMSDLRDHLFAALEGLSDKENPMELDRAEAIAAVGQVVINSAKVEVELIKAVGGLPGSTFFEVNREDTLPQLGRRKELIALPNKP